MVIQELIEMRNYCSAVAVAIALHLLRPLTKEWKVCPFRRIHTALLTAVENHRQSQVEVARAHQALLRLGRFLWRARAHGERRGPVRGPPQCVELLCTLRGSHG